MDIDDILLTEEAIQSRISQLGRLISADYRGRSPLLVGVLRGAVFFVSDLMRRLDVPCELDFAALASYHGETESRRVRWRMKVEAEIAGRDVLVVEDIVDTGKTLFKLLRELRKHQPSSLRACTLLDKPSRRQVVLDIDYVGFTIPDRFVVGYGLDHAGRFRQLPYVATLKKQVTCRKDADHATNSIFDRS